MGGAEQLQLRLRMSEAQALAANARNPESPGDFNSAPKALSPPAPDGEGPGIQAASCSLFLDPAPSTPSIAQMKGQSRAVSQLQRCKMNCRGSTFQKCLQKCTRTCKQRIKRLGSPFGSWGACR